MLKSVSKKLLSGVLALAMVLTLVAVPAVDASAAIKSNGYKLTDRTSVTAGAKSVAYKVTGVKKGTKVTVLVTSGVYVGKTRTATADGARKITLTGTGKTLTFYVKVPETYTKTKANVKVTVAKTSSVAKTVLKDSVTVAAAEEEEEATAISSFTATGAKQLTVVFNKSVSYTSSDFTVKKGTSTPTVSSIEVSGTTAVITLGSKITEGTYTVTVDGLTASVDTKDETLSGYETIGTIVARTTATGTTGTIAYKAVNQYGEAMADSGASTTCSLGTQATPAAGSSSEGYIGIITVENIYTTYANGQEGTLVIVNQTNGAKLSETVTLGAPATVGAATVVGVYDTANDTYANIAAGRDVNDYVVVISLTDIYGNEIAASSENATKYGANGQANGLYITLSPGITGVTYAGTMSVVTIDSKKYLALDLAAAKAVSGSYYLNVVSTSTGSLINDSLTVEAGTEIKSVSISADSRICGLSKTELNYVITDTTGAEITDYETLSKKITALTASDGGTIAFYKQSDGSAKLYYTPATVDSTHTNDNNKEYTVRTITVNANEATSSNFYVGTFSLTVYEDKVATSITGISSKQDTAFVTGSGLAFNAANFIIEDQYSDVMSAAELASTDVVIGNTDNVTGDNTTLAYADSTTFEATAGTYDIEATIDGRSDDAYTFTIASVSLNKATSITIDSINKGSNLFYAAGVLYADNEADADNDVVVGDGDAANSANSTAVVVKAKVGSYTVKVPADSFTITDLGATTVLDTTTTRTATGTMEVAVDVTKNGETSTLTATKEYTYSNTDAALTTIMVSPVATYDGTAAKAGTAMSASTVLGNTFWILDQYGQAFSAASNTAVKFTVVDTSTAQDATISKNGTNAASVAWAAAGTRTINLTITYGSTIVNADITLTVS